MKFAYAVSAERSSFLFNVIGEKSRLKIIQALFEKSLTATEIKNATKIEKSLVSKHLKILRESKIVHAEKFGRHVHYTLNPKLVATDGRPSLYLSCCEVKLK